MNEVHLQRCSSAEWAQAVEEFILPWALKDIDLGDDVIEVGPGPGLTTDVLRRHVSRLTAVETDATLAADLAARVVGTNVEVVHADATDMPFEDDRFSAAGSFTMLHHVPSPQLQDQLLAEIAASCALEEFSSGSTASTAPSFGTCTKATCASRSTRPHLPTVFVGPASSNQMSKRTNLDSGSPLAHLYGAPAGPCHTLCES